MSILRQKGGRYILSWVQWLWTTFPSLPLPKYCFHFCNTKTLNEIKMANLNILTISPCSEGQPLCCPKTLLNIFQFFIHSHCISKCHCFVPHTYIHTYWITLKSIFIPTYCYNTMNIIFQMINAVYAYFTLLKDRYDNWLPVIPQHNCTLTVVTLQFQR